MKLHYLLPLSLKLIFIISLPGLLLVGCQSTAWVEPVGTQPTAPTALTDSDLGEDVLVFGRIRWIQNDEERTDYKSGYGWNIWPQYYRLEDEQHGTLSVAEDGTFTWQLPRGTYLAYQLKWFDNWDGWHRMPLRLAFQVPHAHHAYCVGTLIIKLQAKRDLIGGLWVKDWDLALQDSCDEDRQWFEARYANLTLPLAKSLLVYDPNIPDSIQTLENKDNITDILRAIYPLFMPVEMP